MAFLGAALKILQLIQKPQLRGAEIFASQLGNQLITLGHACTLVTLFEGEAHLPFQGEIVTLNRPLKKRLWDFTGWKQLADRIKQDQPDIIQANAGDTLKFAVLSKLVFGWKTPIIFRNANKMSDFIDSKPKYILNNFFLHRVAHVISVSEACSADLIDFFHFPQSRMDTVEIGIEATPASAFPEDLLPLKQRGPLWLNVGGLVPEKNQKGLLHIFAGILTQIPNARLLIIGQGRLEGELKQRAQALQLENAVHFLGTRTDVQAIMPHCEAFLLPSHIEGLPGVILEAMYARCPVVAYNVGGISEVVEHEVTGMLIPKDAGASFARAAVELYHNPPLKNQITEAAYHQVTTRFTNATIATRFESVYKKVNLKSQI